MDMSGDQVFIVAIVGLLLSTITTSIVSPLVLWLVSKEQRRRDLEDRKMVADAAKEAAKMAQSAAEHARTTATVTLEKLNNVHADVAIIGEKADLSYKEANQANLKIQSLQDAMTAKLGLDQKDITETTINMTEEAL